MLKLKKECISQLAACCYVPRGRPPYPPMKPETGQKFCRRSTNI